MNSHWVNLEQLLNEKKTAEQEAQERRAYWRYMRREIAQTLGIIAVIVGFCLILWMIFGDKK